uniref:RUN domain-containing protein n=1 Tax=Brugia timori TaxID=42155 RepID=A0A0R3QCX3_9BILA
LECRRKMEPYWLLYQLNRCLLQLLVQFQTKDLHQVEHL